MMPKQTLATYVRQWPRALRAGAYMLHADHNALYGETNGPRRPIMRFPGSMMVVPQDTEVAEIVSTGDFTLVDGPFEHPFFEAGYAALYALNTSRDTS